MDNGGVSALSELRIGCIQCAGDEVVLCREASHAPAVFNFLLHMLRRKPKEVAAVAEIMNQLMASPSWAAVFEGSAPLQESIRELPEETQAALGLQHEKVMKCISESAKQRAEREDVEESVKKVAPLMKSLRPTAAAAHKAPAPVEEVWKSARTPQGHTYYFNL